MDPAGQNLTDQDLMQRSSRGDGAALEMLMERHARRAVAYAYSILRHREDALDAAQNALAQLAQELRQAPLSDPFIACLLTRTRNAALQLLNQNAARKRREVAATKTATGDSAMSEPHEKAETLAALREEMLSLPEDAANVLVLHHMEDLSVGDVAQQCGISLEACKKRLYRAREDLRQRMEKRGVVVGSAMMPALLQNHFQSTNAWAKELSHDALRRMTRVAATPSNAMTPRQGSENTKTTQTAKSASSTSRAALMTALVLIAALGSGAAYYHYAIPSHGAAARTVVESPASVPAVQTRSTPAAPPDLAAPITVPAPAMAPHDPVAATPVASGSRNIKDAFEHLKDAGDASVDYSLKPGGFNATPKSLLQVRFLDYHRQRREITTLEDFDTIFAGELPIRRPTTDGVEDQGAQPSKITGYVTYQPVFGPDQAVVAAYAMAADSAHTRIKLDGDAFETFVAAWKALTRLASIGRNLRYSIRPGTAAAVNVSTSETFKTGGQAPPEPQLKFDKDWRVLAAVSGSPSVGKRGLLYPKVPAESIGAEVEAIRALEALRASTAELARTHPDLAFKGTEPQDFAKYEKASDEIVNAPAGN